jgi:hypothetical protein
MLSVFQFMIILISPLVSSNSSLILTQQIGVYIKKGFFFSQALNVKTTTLKVKSFKRFGDQENQRA